jgi:hypothetical protein
MPAPSPASSRSVDPAASVRDAPYICPECLAAFKPNHWRSLFCCAEHKRAWHKRASVRGARLYAFAGAARETREGTRGELRAGREAARLRNMLLQTWRDEDRAAGRMMQAEYIRRRMQLGFCEI